MTWTKTSDDFPDDCWKLSSNAYRLHHEGLSWSNRKLLDCRIELSDLPRFAKCPDALDELLRAGFWQRDGEDHVVIRHHAGYQRTREQEIARQESSRSNGRKGGRPRGSTSKPSSPTPETHPVTHWVSEQVPLTAGADTPALWPTVARLGAETQSLTQQLTQSKTQRDGYGTGLEEGGVQNELVRCELCRDEPIYGTVVDRRTGETRKCSGSVHRTSRDDDRAA